MQTHHKSWQQKRASLAWAAATVKDIYVTKYEEEEGSVTNEAVAHAGKYDRCTSVLRGDISRHVRLFSQ
jgi:hypothetical protein